LEGTPFAKKKVARLEEWKIWLSEFIEIKPGAEPITHAAELLNDYYWKLAIYYLKPLLDYTDSVEHNLHYYKIISASEITVMAVVPLKLADSDDKEKRQQLNAEFACFIASAIMGNWKIKGTKVINDDKLVSVLQTKELIDKVENEFKYYPLSLMDEHIEWLKDLNTAAALPILSNSHTWRAIYLASKI